MQRDAASSQGRPRPARCSGSQSGIGLAGCLGIGLAVVPVANFAQDAPAESTAVEAPSPADAGAPNGPPGDAAVETVPVDSASTGEPAEQRRSQSRLVEEIVVTAQKREENLQDVPLSVVAFSGEALDARGITNPQDLALATPGMSFTTTAAFSLVYIRGLGTDAFLLADPSVALYIDGIYFPFAHGLAQSFGALERVEVEKGPQGTLFGRNAIGGAINIITREPGQEFEAELQTSYANFDQSYNRIYVNLPLTETLAISASGLYNREDSYYHARAGGEPLPDEVSRGARFKAHWTPLDSLSVSLSYYILSQQGTSSMYAPNDYPKPILGLPIRPAEKYHGDVDFKSFMTVHDRVFYGQVTGKFEWLDVKFLASRQYVNTPSGYDFDGSTLPVAYFYADDYLGSTIKTGELQLLSNDTSWGSDWLQWTAGAYYFESTAGADAYLAPGPTFLGDILLVRLSGDLRTESVAGYAQTTVDVTDWAAITLGGRYQSEKRFLLNSSSNIVLLDGALSAPLFNFQPAESTTNRFSPKVSLEIRPFDDFLAYATYQTATKSGTYNIINVYNPPDYVKPEKVKATEVGFKSRLFDRNVQFNGALFHYDDRNLQIQFISLASSGATNFENADRATIKGADFDAVVQLVPSLVDDLVLTAGGAYIDAKFKKYDDGSGYNEATGIYYANGDFAGKRIVRTPKYSGNLGMSKTFTFEKGALELYADIYYSSHVYYLAQNTQDTRQDGYSVVNAHISYDVTPWDLRLTVFGQNLTDEAYSTGMFITDFGRNNYLSRPRSYGIRLNWEF